MDSPWVLVDGDLGNSRVIDTIEQLRIIIRENLLPRITELEEEVRLLRKVCWPVRGTRP